MPRRDGSYFSVINKLQSRTSYLGHLADQQSLNEGKTTRINSNGKSASVVSDYAMGSSGYIESVKPLVYPPTKPIILTSNSITKTSFVITWADRTESGSISYTYTLNGIATTPSSLTSQSATFSNLVYNTLYRVVIIATNSGGSTSSDAFSVTTLPISLTVSGESDTFTVKYSTDGIAQWAQKIGGVNYERPANILLDSMGNVYVTGYYNSATLIISDTISLTNSSSLNDTFIVKLSNDGTPQWAKTININEISSTPFLNMLLDSTGNLYVTGNYTSSELRISDNISFTCSGGHDIFIVKYSTDGIVQWARSIGGIGSEKSVSMLLDSSGNVYLSGYYNSNQLTISPNISLINSGSTDVFIVKYSTHGIAEWAQKIGGLGTESPLNMLLDSTGNVYISGIFTSSPLTISPSITLINSGAYDTFVVKYLTDGTASWAQKIGGTASDRSAIMLLDSIGNVYISGYYDSPQLTISTITLQNLTNPPTLDIFIVKFLTDGTPNWAKTIGGSMDTSLVKMLLDSTGNAYVCGFYKSPILNILGFTTNTSSEDTFIVKYSTNGIPVWAKTISGTAEDIPVNMLLDSTGNVYLSGYYTSSALTISPTISLINSGAYDTFVVKYSTDGIAQWARSIGGTANDLPINMQLDSSGNVYLSGYYDSSALTISPTISLTNSGNTDTFIVKYLTDGKPVWAKNINDSDSLEWAKNMVLDSSGNVYISGYYYSSVLFI
jgi:hypothetical protein